ncbi:MAG: hypothetical protein GY729_11560 [Desulfobacteraceae bacterium]|nr:hypothetical protein [Desulfobacteraceae bacterium]
MKNKIQNWVDSLENKNNPDEYESKQLVRLFGIGVPEGERLSPGSAFEKTSIDPPYVLKVCSSTILHKTELQGVILNSGPDTVADDRNLMQKRFPKENILVEHQSSFTGPEFIIGIIKDSALGHAVMVGAGGVFTEIYKDTAFRLAPCSVADAGDMIEELALSPVFDNFRGLTLDKEKLAKTVSAVSQLADKMGDKLSQLDINPIVFCDEEWLALDVKVMLEP